LASVVLQDSESSVHISQTFVDLELGELQHFRRLAVVPLVRRRVSQHCETGAWYLTLDEATSRGLVTIREVDGGGRVPEVQVTNIADQPVLFIDGDELIGAKQNRVVNLTILVPAFTTLKIPVSCVEAGRWKARSHTFIPARHMEFAAARASRMDQVSSSLTACGMAIPDQAAVWNKVHLKSVALPTHSPTSAMADIFERHASSVEDYVRRFESVPGQVGAIMAIGGEAVGVEILDHPRTLAALLPKILRGYGLDAIEPPRSPGCEPEPTILQASNLLALVADASASAETFPGVGLGETLRLRSNGVTGAALILNHQVVHLSAFTQEYGR
jgi:hypothetical protein